MASPNESSSSSPLEMGIEKFTDKNFEEKELSSQSLGLNGDEFLVEYDANDTSDPQTWSRAYRWYLTALASMLQFCATFSSSAPSGVLGQLVKYFNLSSEVANLTLSLFVAGYCLGPILWGPLSEEYGRRRVFLVTFTAYTAFQIGCALSKNTASILIFRLLSGTFAAAPLSNSGALVSDIWDARTRGKAMALYVVAPLAGPALGPIVSGLIDEAKVSWRWLFWASAIFSGSCLVLIILTLPETYTPNILSRKAKAIRKKTGDNRYYTTYDRLKLSLFKQMIMILTRSFKMMIHEPMLIVVNIYISFLYGCTYLLFEAYPIVFTKGHHMSSGKAGLMFVPVFLGSTLAVTVYMVYFNPKYKKAVEAYKPNPVPPEERLGLAMLCAPLFAISFFWFGWTSYPYIPFWVPMFSGLTNGMAFGGVFIALQNYIIDTYLYYAASALAMNTVCRSVTGAVFPLFANQMYESLNPRWASTVIGCFAMSMVPIPFLLSRYGAYLRQKSGYNPARKGEARNYDTTVDHQLAA